MALTMESLAAQSNGLARLQKTYTTADTDGNGALSKAEFEAAAASIPGLSGTGKGTAATTFNQLDTNRDGLVTKAEIQGGINLSTQVQAVLLQAQEITSGSSLLGLLGTESKPASLFGTPNNFAGLTGSLLGGASVTSSLTSALTGANAGTAALSGLLGGLTTATASQIQYYLEKYTATKPS